MKGVPVRSVGRSKNPSKTVVRVTDDLKRELNVIRCSLQLNNFSYVSYGDVVQFLLNEYHQKPEIR